jgi:predicted small secreted protein
MGKREIMKTRLILSVMLTGALGLAACDSPAVAGIDTLGKSFVAMFNQDPNSEPVDAQSVELALTPEIEPFNP